MLDDDAPVTADDLAPDGDLDGDGMLNNVDPDVDGDGTANADDPFAYDADNGMTLAAGETKTFDFDIDGTIFQNGLTGFLQGTTNGGAFNEDTGANSVSGGLLTVNPVTGGDTGGTNNPQDDAVVGVKNGTFVAKAVVLNPWVGAATNPGSFDQLGLVIGPRQRRHDQAGLRPDRPAWSSSRNRRRRGHQDRRQYRRRRYQRQRPLPVGRDARHLRQGRDHLRGRLDRRRDGHA